jgi:hypothetical protein
MASVSSTTIDSLLDKQIRDAIQEAVSQAYEPIIEEAKEKLDKALRAELARCVMQVARYYEMSRDMHGVTIRVTNDAKIGRS